MYTIKYNAIYKHLSIWQIKLLTQNKHFTRTLYWSKTFFPIVWIILTELCVYTCVWESIQSLTFFDNVFKIPNLIPSLILTYTIMSWECTYWRYFIYLNLMSKCEFSFFLVFVFWFYLVLKWTVYFACLR